LPKTQKNVAVISGGNIEPQVLAELKGLRSVAQT
jgi:hypothetical protein